MKQYTYFPVKEEKIEALYKEQLSRFWTSESLSFNTDKKDWKKLTKVEQEFYMHIIAFFAMSDNMVVENLMANFVREFDFPEAQRFFTLQAAIEHIHSESYSLMVEHFLPADMRKVIFENVLSLPAIKKKEEWIMRWFDTSIDLRLRIAAFACIEGIFFSGSFASIFLLAKRGLAKGIVFANREISIDEYLHTRAGYTLFKMKGMMNDKDSYLYKWRSGFGRVSTDPEFKQQVVSIVEEAFQIEKEFITSIMKADEITGMTKQDLIDHIYFVSRLVLSSLTGDSVQVETPLEWMKHFNMGTVDSFFESKSSNYNFTMKDSDKFSLTADV